MVKGLKDKKDNKKERLLEIPPGREEAPVDAAAQQAEQAAGQALAEEEGWDASRFLYRDLLSREKSSNQRDYFDLINRLPKSEAPPENYTRYWNALLDNKKQEGYKEMVALLKRTLEGKVLIDLGGGKGEHLHGDGIYEYKTYAPAPMQEIAERFKASAYVNVDRYHTSREIITPHDVTEDLEIEQPRDMHVVYAEGDMLTFISKMSDQKSDVVLALNGIDAFVITKKSYREAFAQEIARVVPSGGAVMTCGSEDITEHLEKMGFSVAEGFPKQGWPAYPQLWIKK